MKIPPLLFPFRCFSLVISPFGVSHFAFFSLVDKGEDFRGWFQGWRLQGGGRKGRVL